MSSERQLAANRANAQKSTGPLTSEGKVISSQNNRKLGLTSLVFQVLPGESQSEFDAYADSLYAEYSPQTLIERTLVLKIAQHYWLGQRAVRAQNMCFHHDFGPVVENRSLMQQMALYMRYQAHHDRAFHKCMAELQKLRNEKRKDEIHAIRIAKAAPRSGQHSVAPAALPVTAAIARTVAPAVEIAA